MIFRITNHIEICDLDYINTSFHNGFFYCLAVRLKPTLCPSEDWITIFRKFFNMRGYENIEIIRSEHFYILRLPMDGVGFYEAKNAMENIISVAKITNDKLQHTPDNHVQDAPIASEDLGSLLFDSFRKIISHEG